MKSSIVMLIKNICVALLLCLVFSNHAEARNCKKGKACGNSCISKNDVCHKDTTAQTTNSNAAVPTLNQETQVKPGAAPQEPPTTQSAAAASGATVKQCKKGKACGNSCIAQDAVCHQ